MKSYIRRPLAATSSLTAQQVAKAYNYPDGTGSGRTVAIIELGGKVNLTDLPNPAGVSIIDVDGAKPVSDGPDGADAEVMLDVEVVQAVAPNAAVRVYFGPNTDAGFLDAIKAAVADLKSGDAISISWGGPESSWSGASMDAFDAVFAQARQKGIGVYAAAGDSGSDDGTSSPSADFPASSPNVVGCGGTRLTLNADGTRAAEVAWDDNDRTSASGGGVSTHFPGRDVPDVAGNADPQTGYQVKIDGGQYVIGGTSAVAPLYAGLHVRLTAITGQPLDMLTVIPANPTVCFDVTAGDNGAYRAGPGRDQVTGFGVVDGTRLLTVLQASAPPVTPPPVTPPPTQPPTDVTDTKMAAAFDAWAPTFWARWTKTGKALIAAGDAWEQDHGYSAARP